MASKIKGLDNKTLSQIRQTILRHKTVEKLLIFGSRAKGNFKETSDIDIAIFGKEWTDKDINIIKNTLTEFLKTPLKIDIVNFYALKKNRLKENILKRGEIFYDSRKNSRDI